MKTTLPLIAMLAITAFTAPSAYAETYVTKDAQGNTQVVEVGSDQNPWVTGITSAILPGWGQGINGDWLKGGLHLAGAFAVSFASSYLFPTNVGAQLGMNWGYKSLSAFEAISTTTSMNADRMALRQRLQAQSLPSLDLSAASVQSEWHLSLR